MRIKLLSFIILLLCFNLSSAQKDETLLTIEGEDVSTDEFLKLYNKNLDLVKDESQKQLDTYLELFVSYKLKLKEAERLGLNKDANYKREFENYKKQLTKNYLSDNKVTDALVKEAYDRMSYDIKASHILILEDPEEEDTLVAYNKLLDYRKTLSNKGYQGAKAKYHNGNSVLVEDLGYFSAFKMVYDFESVAYKTKPGEVSMPFKTDFGYHVVKVDEKRPSRGTATAAHIMVSLKQNDSTINPEERINQIYKKLEQGEAFDALAKQFSDDKSSARNGGKLRAFKSGQLSSTVFENAAFELDNEEISKPIKTKFGWHIIKLINKQPIQSFEELKPSLESQVKRDARSKLINSAMVNKLSKRYEIKKNPEAKVYFEPILKGAYFSGKFNLPKDYKSDTPVVTVNDSVYTNNDFLHHLKAKQRKYMRQQTTVKKVLETEFELFYEQSVLDFREKNLVNENKDFADVLQEYRDGLLLFALMEKEIWNKASKDSIGLKKYYDANKVKYQWEDRIDVTIATTNNAVDAEKIMPIIRRNDSLSLLKSEIKNNGFDKKVILTTGIFEKSSLKLPSELEFKIGTSKIYNHNDGFHVFKIHDVIEAREKTLKEARGSVVNDYQNQIEEEWLASLRKKFKVEVNNKVLKRLKTKINN
ncbi:peptidylprolyl isomerase [Winogradskyella sp. PC-19]|uniref:peptidylprolyl isomerase n=1 Tax=unclassified Winogradskyella TaxID=2615021 RepID=UPI000B3CFFD7|nr:MULTISPECIES: peptidylprolyl isomerase [unclassified Winogradskyella]ARV10631.1 peptidylprolyl isomerase [Winogradskyella sp. PC-19]RZN81000.1 MAG: peptidylprolyl isomerase [Winogradskyella sp.]